MVQSSDRKLTRIHGGPVMSWTLITSLNNDSGINDPLAADYTASTNLFVHARQGDHALGETFYTSVLGFIPLNRPGEDGLPIGDAPIPRPFVGVDFNEPNPSVDFSVNIIQPEEMVRRFDLDIADGLYGVQFGVTYKAPIENIAVSTATVVSIFYNDVTFDRANRSRLRIILGA